MARILLIEDSHAVAATATAALQLRGHTVEWAACVGDALVAFRAAEFDVVLSDYELPDGTGLDFFQTVLDENIANGQELGYWILWSGLDRCEEAAAHPVGDAIDIVESKANMPEVFDLIDARLASYG